MLCFSFSFYMLPLSAWLPPSSLPTPEAFTLGQSERLVFRDLSQLGANTAFLRGCLSSQLRRLFLLPSVIGILSAYLFDFFVMYTNDGHIASTEAMALAINGSICLTAALLLAAAYGYSVKKKPAGPQDVKSRGIHSRSDCITALQLIRLL